MRSLTSGGTLALFLPVLDAGSLVADAAFAIPTQVIRSSMRNGNTANGGNIGRVARPFASSPLVRRCAYRNFGDGQDDDAAAPQLVGIGGPGSEAVGQQEAIKPNSAGGHHHHRLDLDSEGRIRIGIGGGDDGGGGESKILLDGLSPSDWTSTRPTRTTTSDASSILSDNSLFLHTNSSSGKAELDTTVGDLISCNRLLAGSRTTRYWMGPAFGTSAHDVPLDTQFLLIEISPDGPYALLLPLVDGGFRTSLHYGRRRIELVCHAESGDDSVKLGDGGMRALYVSVSDDPFELLKRGFREVADATGTFRTLDEKTLPPSVDEFGWCTWDAFYSKVTPEGVLEGVSALKELDVPPRTLILDDGWQEVSPHPRDWKQGDETSTSTESGTKDNTTASATTSSGVEEAGAKAATSFSPGSALLAALAKVVATFYDVCVKRAPHNSLPNRIWYFLATTILKGQLWDYFDTETDFGRQLSGFLPNYKFQEAERGDEEEPGTSGLKQLVSRLKTELGIRRVYCWHALHGYWRGVDPELGKSIGVNVTNVMTRPSNHLLSIEPQLAWDSVSLFGVGLMSDPADLAKFYRHLHTPLVEAGVDGVKVDVQSGVSAVGRGVGGGPHLARIYTEAMESSVSEHFSSPAEDGDKTAAANCINCMCHSTENLYRYQVTSVARASDDFYPDRPNSHTVHLINVAYNSLFLGEICLPDWDMFHSKHESASLHAAARAIGGCPVYVSDEPGKHDAELLKKLVLPDGTVLRAKLPGRPTRDCLFTDVGKDGISAMKIWNENPSGGGVVGAFNVQGVAWNFDTNDNEVVNASPPDVTAAIKPHDVESLCGVEGPFVAWRHRSGKLEVLPDGDAVATVDLGHRDWEIFTITPIQGTSDNGVAWGPIGLADKFNSGGALIDAGKLERVNAKTTRANLLCRGPGRFVAYCQPAPSRVLIVNGDERSNADISFSHDATSGELSFALPNEKGGAHQLTVIWE